MKVKVGDRVYSYLKQPVMVVLAEQDKKNIANMPPEATRYCSYPTEGWTKEEILEWMKDDGVTAGKKTDRQILYEDPTCEAWCHCGYKLFISDHAVFRCPKCGRGYRTEFIVYEYAPDEQDDDYENRPGIEL